MKALCKKNLYSFKKGEYYDVDGIHSIFEKDDFISIRVKGEYSLNTPQLYRFNYKGTVAHYVEDYIGWNELNFFDYFCSEQEERKEKLQTIQKITPKI
jgi:hypothetical protein